MRPRKEALITTLLRFLLVQVRELDKEYPVASQSRYLMSDCVLSALAMFWFKQPNLFCFVQRCQEEPVFLRSVQHLFRLSAIPSDTTIRRRLDELPSAVLGDLFAVVFRYAQRQKLLEPFRSSLDAHLLLAVDGTGGVSSTKIHCDSCLTKRTRRSESLAEDGGPVVVYSHQTLGATLVHPAEATVLPFAPEAIAGRDAAGVQDSELKAAFRWLTRFRRTHPKLAVVFLGDALYANGPFIKALNEHHMKYMIRVKPHKKDAEYAYLADPGVAWIASQREPGMHSRLLPDEPLNQAHPQLRVSVLQQYDAKGKVSEWITNRELTADQVEPAITEARSRWRIENASFQTLKASQGPHFEHNHGHGYQHLASNFPLLMMLQLLLEQLCFRVCRWYQAALAGPKQAKKVFKAHFWDRQYARICVFVVSCWEALYEHLANPPILPLPTSRST